MVAHQTFIVSRYVRVTASEPICMSRIFAYNMQVVRLYVRGAAIRLPPAMMGRGWAGTFRFMVWANTGMISTLWGGLGK
jgi:hypothetical protein